MIMLFSNWDITIKEGTFYRDIYKSFDKRDSSSFQIVRMSHTERNILSNNLYSATKAESLKIACSTVCLSDFITKIRELIEHMKLFKK